MKPDVPPILEKPEADRTPMKQNLSPLSPPIPKPQPGDDWSRTKFPRLISRSVGGPKGSDEVRKIRVLPLREWKP
jgi:hypothetical protein